MDERARKARIREILDSMHGKHTTLQICAQFRKEKLIPPVDQETHDLEWTRREIESHGRDCDQEDRLDQRLFNLSEVLPDGSSQNYYKQPPSMTKVESVQALAIEAKRCRRQARKYWRLYDVVTGIHGKRVIDGMLPFRPPERPEDDEDEGAEV